MSRVVEVVADGVVVDGSAVVGVVVDERRKDDGLVVDVVVEALQTVDGSVAVELTVVGTVVDERRTVAGLAADDGSVVGGVNDSVWPYWAVYLDHTCFASVSITKEAAENIIPQQGRRDTITKINRVIQHLTTNLDC